MKKVLCYLFGHICRIYSFTDDEVKLKCLRCGKRFTKGIK